MIINKVAIAGADDAVDIQVLEAISQRYPFVEWAILISSKLAGSIRYPSKKWVTKLLSREVGNLSAHFCGWYAREVLENQNYQLIDDLDNQFKRIQLNYNFSKRTDWDIETLVSYAETNSKVDIILQYNKANKRVLDGLVEHGIPSNIHMLYDTSGGRGVTIKQVDNPFDGIYTGYAGGITPDNVAEIANQITSIPKCDVVWLDLESGVRTNNQFDLSKVESLLQQSTNYRL